ncbi:MAG: hypothetical protein IKN27_06770, partial [Selenomonadaceae bacterium]|nr:hypothetical protein [Selenomonadaceae bacterium]
FRADYRDLFDGADVAVTVAPGAADGAGAVKVRADQIIAIPQFGNFTLSTTNSGTLKFNGAQGGIFAIAVKDTCNLSSGIIDVLAKGGGAAYGRAGLGVIGNAQDNDKLPLGQGHGSIFILANKLTMNSATRLGFNGNGAKVYSYRCTNNQYSGSGASNGTGSYNGGYGSNGIAGTSYRESNGYYYHCQGAHVMIVADTITGFNMSSICTGGGWTSWGNGAAGVGGSSTTHGYYSYNGGAASSSTANSSGGSSGWAFVYCNNFVNPSTSGVILAN